MHCTHVPAFSKCRFKLVPTPNSGGEPVYSSVLAAESLVAVYGCDIQRGKWLSYYDGVTTALSTGFDVDHLVRQMELFSREVASQLRS